MVLERLFGGTKLCMGDVVAEDSRMQVVCTKVAEPGIGDVMARNRS